VPPSALAATRAASASAATRVAAPSTICATACVEADPGSRTTWMRAVSSSSSSSPKPVGMMTATAAVPSATSWRADASDTRYASYSFGSSMARKMRAE